MCPVETIPPVAEKKFEFTPTDVQRLHKAHLELFARMAEMDGTSEVLDLGYNNYHGSPATVHQLVFALAMSEHELVKDVLQRPIPEGTTRHDVVTVDDVERFVAAQVLKGIKMLDLGSGSTLRFARWARKLGAEVFTADTLSPSEFQGAELLTPAERKVESDSHTTVDISREDAAAIIKERSGGEFVLVTEANLKADNFDGGSRIAEPLLRKGGIYSSFFLPDYEYGVKREDGKFSSVLP